LPTGERFPESGQRADHLLMPGEPRRGEPRGLSNHGPLPWQNSFFQYCKPFVANTKTGSTIYVGAPTGTAQALAVQLSGSVPPLHECPAPR
jgi:hypothetical protein